MERYKLFWSEYFEGTVLLVSAIGIFAYNKNMSKSSLRIKQVIAGSLLLFIFLLPANSSSEEGVLDLSQLHGNWTGSGSYLVPFTTMTASIDGQAKFIYDSSKGYLRTFLTADNLLFGYSDSGHLQIIPNSDSAVWEIWSSWGYHLRYRGKVSGNTIHGSRQKGKLRYDVYFEIVNSDSISCRLILTDEKGESREQASCSFKRVAEK